MTLPKARSRIGLVVATGVGVVGMVGFTASAPAERPATAGKRACVGTWAVDAQPGRGVPPGPKLLTLFADGNVILSEPGALQSQNGAGLEFVGPGQGSYISKPVGCNFTARVLVADDKGVPTGYAEVSGTASVDPEQQTISGPFAITRVKANGDVVGTARTTFTGTRVGQS